MRLKWFRLTDTLWEVSRADNPNHKVYISSIKGDMFIQAMEAFTRLKHLPSIKLDSVKYSTLLIFG